ncbi:MAG: M56 family metallopeptidase [Candidatus Latescibacteria bacterium]|nr:M56 family metallopeptidase [Candidatus Latescibacterota bacterium]
MTDTVLVLSELDSLGRSITDTFLLPSIEALLLGLIVWVGLRINPNASPRIRHLLWLFVIVKPLISVAIPLRGPLPLPVAAMQGDSSAALTVSLGSAETWGQYLYGGVAIIWVTCMLGAAVWKAAGYLVVATRARQTLPIPVPWVEALFSRCQELAGITKHVDLRMSDDFAGPTLIAVGRPIVVMPSWCMIDLTPQELKQVFLHELMHYSRRDHLTLFLVQIVKVCFFFHPLVWYVGRRIDSEAERACDMAVVDVSRRPHSYASSLLKVAEGPVSRGWRGVLELAKSASLTAVRIKEVLGDFGGNQYGLSRKGMLVLMLCGSASVLPFFHIPVLEMVNDVVGVADYDPESPEVSILKLDSGPQSSVMVAPEISIPSVAAIEMSPMEAFHGTPPVVTQSTVDVHNNVRPLARRSPAAALTISRTQSTDNHLNGPEQVISTAMLGLSSVSKTGGARRASDRQLVVPGHIEVQSIGQNTSNQGMSQSMSLRAGYFVTKEHEFGGVLSVVSPTGTDIQESVRERSAPAPSYSGRVSARRNVTPSLGPGRQSLINGSLLGESEDTEEQASFETLRLGAFYRYNVTGLSSAMVPFIGVGTGVELRTGRNPVLVDGGGGLRCFLTGRSAVVVQVDYVRDIVFSNRSRVNASLGFSTIF